MNAIRTFIAIHLPEWMQKILGEIVNQLNSPPLTAVRWIPPQNMHLTLKFLGDVSPSNLDILSNVVRSEVARQQSFEMTIGKLGAFPTIQRPRVIWVGVQAPPSLLRLQRGIETETTKLGYPKEEKSFSPHLTLGRISNNATFKEVHLISNVLEKAHVKEDLGTVPVNAVSIFRSDLRPGGSIYTELYSAPMMIKLSSQQEH